MSLFLFINFIIFSSHIFLFDILVFILFAVLISIWVLRWLIHWELLDSCRLGQPYSRIGLWLRWLLIVGHILWLIWSYIVNIHVIHGWCGDDHVTFGEGGAISHGDQDREYNHQTGPDNSQCKRPRQVTSETAILIAENLARDSQRSVYCFSDKSHNACK